MATPSPPSSRQGNPNRGGRPTQLIQTRYAIDDIITSQGTLRRDVLKNDATVQAVRQENILLAEKVQHATNLYRQLLDRVSKTEARMEMEQKSVTQVISQAKQVELQLAGQQEGLMNRETQIVLQLQKLQEDISILKNEKEQIRKQNVALSHEVRQLQDKVTRQSGSLSNGLQDLKVHLDQKDMEKSQMFNLNFNELREKFEGQEHQRVMFQTQIEGLLETLKMQIHQYEKQRQEDVYNMSTQAREKETLAKADIRRLQEKFKDVFEEFNKNMSGKDGRLRSDLQGRVAELEKKLQSQSKDVIQKLKEVENDAEEEIRHVKDLVDREIEIFREKLENGMTNDLNSNSQLDKIVKVIEKQINQNKKDIEKVVRAEISSRLSQGEKLSQQLSQVHRDYSEGIATMQETISDNRRKQETQIESNKVDVLRVVNAALKENRCTFDEKRFHTVEDKIEEIEDGLDEMSKQDERIDMNSERIKQIEMENILAQGDMHNAVDANTKLIKRVEDTLKEKLETERELRERPSTAFKELKEYAETVVKKHDIMPSQIRLLEKKLNYLTDDFDEYKKEQEQKAAASPQTEDVGTSDRKKIQEVDEQLQKIRKVIIVLQKVLTEKIDDEQKKNKKDYLINELKKQMDKLNDIDDKNNDNDDDEDDVDVEEEEDEDDDEPWSDDEEGKDDDDEDEEDDGDDEEDDGDSDGESFALSMALEKVNSESQSSRKLK